MMTLEGGKVINKLLEQKIPDKYFDSLYESYTDKRVRTGIYRNKTKSTHLQSD